MAVIVGSARSDENGKYNGGKPGDQNLKEVSTQNWYLHPKGWVMLRAKDAKTRKKIAKAMKAACDNQNIGYAQDTRMQLFNVVKTKGYDPAKCNVQVNTDCSGLVRICVCYAGIIVGNFTTLNELDVLQATGKFHVYKDPKYTAEPSYLMAGDILVTKTKGHTVIVLTDGPLVEKKDYVLYMIKKGDVLSRIAKEYGTTVKAILEMNPEIENPDKIKDGQKIKIPM